MKYFITFLVMFFTYNLAEAKSIMPPFNTKEIINKISHTPTYENNKIVNKDESYNTQNLFLTPFKSGEFLIDTNVTYIPAPDNQISSSIAFDGTSYFVAWQDGRNGDNNSDLYGARLNSTGGIINSFNISAQSGNQYIPAVAVGKAGQILVAYLGETDFFINNHQANIMRIWGKFYPFVGNEETNPQPLTPNLQISPNPFRNSTTIKFNVGNNRDCSFKIYDISGKLVNVTGVNQCLVGVDDRSLTPTYPEGHNQCQSVALDSKNLSSGVYFITLSTGTFKTTQKLILMK